MNENIKRKLRIIAYVEGMARNITIASTLLLLVTIIADFAGDHNREFILPLFMITSCVLAIFLPVWVWAILARVGGAK